MARKRVTRKTSKKKFKPPYKKGIGIAVDPLPAMTQGDENMVSPERVAQEATPQPYEGQYEQFRARGETDRSGILQENSRSRRSRNSKASKRSRAKRTARRAGAARTISLKKKVRRRR